jgi:hypothetical protein
LYATAHEYRIRNDQTSASDDGLIAAVLSAVSRVVDRRVGVAPGAFLPVEDATRYFDGRGRSVLVLRDSSRRQHFLRTVESIRIDGGDGEFSVAEFDLDEPWVRALPEGNDEMAEPFDRIELLGFSSASIARWPNRPRSVEITGDWGWAEVPGAIRERVISIARELLDAHRAGATLQLQSIDTSIQLTPGARSLMAMLEKEYRYRGLVVA